MNEALRNPIVRDAMRGKIPTAPRAPGASKVMEAQRLLNARGFDAGTPDGIAGAGTRRAIAAFQTSIGRAPTGELTAEEFAILKSEGEEASSSAQTAPRNPDALEVQSLLTDLGFDPGPVDGAWGRRSQAALEEFRQREGSGLSGQPTNEDIALLRAALAPGSSTVADGAAPTEEPPAPTLFALPIVDRGMTFNVAWDSAPEAFSISIVPLWSEVSVPGTTSRAMPTELLSPDRAGLYHLVMVDNADASVVARLMVEVR